VVRGSNHNGVDVITGQQFSEVVILSTSCIAIGLIHALPGHLSHVGFYIADCDDVGNVLVEEVLHNTTALRADTDAADHNPIAW